MRSEDRKCIADLVRAGTGDQIFQRACCAGQRVAPCDRCRFVARGMPRARVHLRAMEEVRSREEGFMPGLLTQ